MGVGHPFHFLGHFLKHVEYFHQELVGVLFHVQLHAVRQALEIGSAIRQLAHMSSLRLWAY